MPQQHHLRSVHDDGGTAILDTARGVLSTLNPTGGFIWQALQDGKSKDEIVGLLVAETNGPTDIVAKDVADFIQELEANALISRATKGPGHADSIQCS